MSIRRVVSSFNLEVNCFGFCGTVLAFLKSTYVVYFEFP